MSPMQLVKPKGAKQAWLQNVTMADSKFIVFQATMWPNVGGPPTARDLLTALQVLVTTELPVWQLASGQRCGIRDEDRQRILVRIGQLMFWKLTNAKGVPVCELTHPDAWTELDVILREARNNFSGGSVANDANLWTTVADKLDAFPTGDLPVPQP